MVRYKINNTTLSSDRTEIPLLTYSTDINVDDESLLTITCYYENDLNLTTSNVIEMVSTHDVETVYPDTVTTNTFTTYAGLTMLDTNLRWFSYNISRWFDLKITEIQILDVNGEAWLHFDFEDKHYFSSWDDDITFYVDFYANDGVMYEKAFENCQYDTETSLLWKYDSDSPDIDLFMCTVFNNDQYKFVGYSGSNESVQVEGVPSVACFSDPIYVKLLTTVGCEDRFEYYEKECNEGNVHGLEAYRDSFMLEDFELYTYIGKLVISVPFSQKHDVALEQEQNIMEHFVYDETRKAINGGVEMERLVYHPVYQRDPDEFPNEEAPFHTEDIQKIKFNLHFRQHRGEDWTVDDGVYWNGCDNANILLDESFPSTVGHPYYSYNDKSKQSDLLSYLNFTNGDVKYQKNKLKKSFIRLSFYDSMDPNKQNLLAYSTVFMDAGKLFSRYMNNMMTSGYAISGGDGSNTFVGAKVNLEFAPDDLRTDYTDDEIEEHRLSTQFTVEGPYSSKASSEGFNLYLWADNDNGNIPSDIFMKVEFNHAGYGRTIPFMMPYYDYHRDGRYGIKTFDEIMKDWRVYGGYGMRKYTRYSYIHLKYRYDKEKEKHVYYLDPETYGQYAYYNRQYNMDESLNELEINLYEAKVNFLNEN